MPTHKKATEATLHIISFFRYFIFLVVTALGDNINEVRISGSNDASTFLDNVNSGKNYSGTTIYLENDFVFNEAIANTPIGGNNNQFRGTFDGQGHVVDGLKFVTSSQYAGFFGYSSGMTIRNLVLGSSFSVSSTCSINAGIASVGSLVGECDARNGPCIFENIVSLANVTFSGSKVAFLNIGGIVGSLGGHQGVEEKSKAVSTTAQ